MLGSLGSYPRVRKEDQGSVRSAAKAVADIYRQLLACPDNEYIWQVELPPRQQRLTIQSLMGSIPSSKIQAGYLKHRGYESLTRVPTGALRAYLSTYVFEEDRTSK